MWASRWLCASGLRSGVCSLRIWCRPRPDSGCDRHLRVDLGSGSAGRPPPTRWSSASCVLASFSQLLQTSLVCTCFVSGAIRGRLLSALGQSCRCGRFAMGGNTLGHYAALKAIRATPQLRPVVCAQTHDMWIVLNLLPPSDAVVLHGACWVYLYSRFFDSAMHVGAGRIPSPLESVAHCCALATCSASGRSWSHRRFCSGWRVGAWGSR